MGRLGSIHGNIRKNIMDRKEKLEKQIECVDKSLTEKWNNLDESNEEDWSEALSWTNCACCLEYYFTDEENECLGCPIYEKTGKPDCAGTPFEEISLNRFSQKMGLFEKERQFLRELKSELEEELRGLNGG